MWFSGAAEASLYRSENTLPEFSFARIVNSKRILHFAPESVVADVLRRYASQYMSADLMDDAVDLRIDMCEMSSLGDHSFDLVVACDVLEHLSSDDKAMHEMFRIFSPAGWAVPTVPRKDQLPHKYEDSSIDSPSQREQAYGQTDRLRIYGDDFAAYLSSFVFVVTVVGLRGLIL